MAWLAALLVAVAVSLDGLAVGASYGLRRIAIPWVSLAILGGVSSLLVAAVTVAAWWAGAWLPAAAARRLGGALLVLLGLSAAARGLGRTGAEGDDGPLLRLRLPFLGLVVQVVRDPRAADLDRSGRLDGGEAVLLGLSLALDAVAAGLAMALNGGGLRLAALVGPLQVLFLLAGGWLVRRAGWDRARRLAAYAPGSLLVAVGLWRLL